MAHAVYVFKFTGPVMSANISEIKWSHPLKEKPDKNCVLVF